MKRGERVIVTVFGGRELERVVWEDSGPGILLCTEQGFERAIRTGEEPVCVGFPAADVRRKPMSTAKLAAIPPKRAGRGKYIKI